MAMLSFTLIVLTTAIVVLFSTEIGNLIKKLFSIPGVAFFLPLSIASYCVANYDLPIYFFLTKTAWFFDKSVAVLNYWFPFLWTTVASIIVLWTFSFLPALVLNIWNNKKKYGNFPYTYFLNTMLWIFAGILLVLR